MSKQPPTCAVAACTHAAEKKRSFEFRGVTLHVAVCAGCDTLLSALAKQPTEEDLLRRRSFWEAIFG